MVNISTRQIIVSCAVNSGKIPPDSYHIELWANITDSEELELITNLTETERPYFILEDIEPATQYSISIYASNRKGAGTKVWLEGETPDVPKVERSKG